MTSWALDEISTASLVTVHTRLPFSLGCKTGRALNDVLLALAAFLDAEGHLTIPPLRVHAQGSRMACGWHIIQ
jgi:hypothetical protein